MDVFRKLTTDAEAAWIKYNTLFRVAAESGAFRAPRVITCDPEAGVVELERLSNLVPLADILPGLPKRSRLDTTRAIGRILALIHRGFDSIPGHPLQIIAGPDGDLFAGLFGDDHGAAVVVHGDFGLGNILCEEADPKRIVVIDPEPAPFLDIPPLARTHAELDLAHFASTLEGVFPLRHYPRYDWNGTMTLRRSLFDGYTSEASRRLDAQALDELTSRLLRLFAQWLEAPGQPLRKRLFGRFLTYRAFKIVEKIGETT